MAGKGKMATYEVIMPSDYLHILNCICIYSVKKTYKCYNAGDSWRAPATRLTADMYSQVLDNFWNKPTYKRPYYYIHNVNTNHTSVPTNPYKDPVSITDSIPSDQLLTNNPKNGIEITYSDGGDVWVQTITNWNNGTDTLVSTNTISKKSGNYHHGTDISDVTTGGTYHNTPNGSSGSASTYDYGTDGHGKPIVQGEGLPETISVNINGTITEASNRERGQGIRYGNVSEVRLEIRYGTDNTVFALDKVYVDYIKAPQNIRLTQEEIDLTEDTSQMLEYPDYVCQEIINELVHLIMENISHERLQTHPVVSQSIANPAQAQTQQAQGQSA